MSHARQAETEFSKVAHPVGRPDFGVLRRKGLALEQVGLGFATLIPTLVGFALISSWTWRHSLLACGVTWLVWFTCINLGLRANQATLATLGPGFAAARGAVLGVVATAVLGAWIPALRIGFGRSIFVGLCILGLVALWESFVGSHLRAAIRLLVVGPHSACLNLIRALEERPDRRFELVGVVDNDAKPGVRDPLVLGTTVDMPRIVQSVQPDLVALAPGANRPATFAQLLDLSDSGFRVLELAHFYEYAFGKVPVRDLTGAWFMSVLHLYQHPYSRFVKRCADVTGALMLLVLTAPLFALLAVLVRCTRGPILLRQIRVGEHGRLFTMYKFRTMQSDAERPGEAVWAVAHDPRITPAGRLMRRMRLDEIPQIWNVLKGEMSMVGPRPERPEFIELLAAVPYWTRRHLVKPGITGWAQVRLGYIGDADGSFEKLSYDLWYIRHRSLTVDLAICAQTIGAVVRGEQRGARVESGATELGITVVHGALERENASSA